MGKRNAAIPTRRMNPALAAMSAQKRDNMLISAAEKANMILTLTVLHDKFGFGGKERLPRFIHEYGELLDSYNRGYINVQDLEDTLKDECEIEVKI